MLVRVRKMSTIPIEKKAASSSMPQAVMLKPQTCALLLIACKNKLSDSEPKP
jgi:hypothetical protein